MTLREMVLSSLHFPPSHGYRTAAQLFDFIKTVHDERIKLSSLSSVLKKMYDAGELERVDDFGPRGGHGYRLRRPQ